MDKRRAPGWIDLALLWQVLVWGANYSVVKAAVSQMAPMAFNALRFVGASTVTMLLAWIVERDLSIPRRDWGLVLLLGLIGNVLYQILFINGIARTTASNSSLILATSPIFVALMGVLSRTERMRGWNWVGILLAFMGIFLLTTGSGSSIAIQRTMLTGNLLTLAGSLCWATYTLLSRRLVQRNSPLRATAWVMTSTTPLLVLAALPELKAQDWQAVSLKGWLGLLYSATLAIAVGYVIWSTAVRRLGSARTSVYSFLTPLISVMVAWIVLGERLHGVQALGGVAVLVGVVLGRQRAGAYRTSGTQRAR